MAQVRTRKHGKFNVELGAVGKIRQVTVIFPPDESCYTVALKATEQFVVTDSPIGAKTPNQIGCNVTLPVALEPRQSKKFFVTL